MRSVHTFVLPDSFDTVQFQQALMRKYKSLRPRAVQYGDMVGTEIDLELKITGATLEVIVPEYITRVSIEKVLNAYDPTGTSDWSVVDNTSDSA